MMLTLYFLRLGTFGFGGPVALVGYMHRDLVVRHRTKEKLSRFASGWRSGIRRNSSI